MRATTLTMAILFSAATSMTWAAGSKVMITSTPTSPRESAGSLLQIPLYLQSGDDAPLFGAELEVASATEDVAVRSVTVNPAFTQRGGDSSMYAEAALKVTAIQPVGAPDRSLGADGAPVLFATVELEVLTDRPFESGLIVRARGALVGSVPDSTTVLGNPSGPDGWGEGRVVIATEPRSDEATEVGNESGPSDPGSLDPLVPPTDGPEGGPWTVETATAVLEVRAVGGLDPVTTLVAGTTYELAVSGQHSAFSPDGTTATLLGFDLIVIGPPTSVGGSETSGADGPPTSVGGSEIPVFEACWEGATATELEPGEDGAVRRVVSADDLGALDPGTPEPLNPSSVPLCTFTTGSAGALGFDLRLYSVDPGVRHTVEMRATAEFIVE